MKFSLEVISILRNSIRMNVGSSSIALDDVPRTMNIILNNLHHHSGRDVQFVLAHVGLFLHTLRSLEVFIQQDRMAISASVEQENPQRFFDFFTVKNHVPFQRPEKIP